MTWLMSRASSRRNWTSLTLATSPAGVFVLHSNQLLDTYESDFNINLKKLYPLVTDTVFPHLHFPKGNYWNQCQQQQDCRNCKNDLYTRDFQEHSHP
jgi:hypothetical protein